MPQKGHFAETGLFHGGNLPIDAFRLTAPLAPSREGNNAIGAKFVAAPHNAYKTGYIQPGQLERYHISIGFLFAQRYIDRFAASHYIGQQIGQIGVRIGPCHQIHAMLCEQPLLNAFRHAAQYPYYCRFTAFAP